MLATWLVLMFYIRCSYTEHICCGKWRRPFHHWKLCWVTAWMNLNLDACNQALSGGGCGRREKWRESLQRSLYNLKIYIGIFDAKSLANIHLDADIISFAHGPVVIFKTKQWSQKGDNFPNHLNCPLDLKPEQRLAVDNLLQSKDVLAAILQTWLNLTKVWFIKVLLPLVPCDWENCCHQTVRCFDIFWERNKLLRHDSL